MLCKSVYAHLLICKQMHLHYLLYAVISNCWASTTALVLSNFLWHCIHSYSSTILHIYSYRQSVRQSVSRCVLFITTKSWDWHQILSHARKYSIAYALHVLTYISRLRIHAIFMAYVPPLGIHHTLSFIHSYTSFKRAHTNVFGLVWFVLLCSQLCRSYIWVRTS